MACFELALKTSRRACETSRDSAPGRFTQLRNSVRQGGLNVNVLNGAAATSVRLSNDLRLLGAKRSDVKASASRANGRLGGRPGKTDGAVYVRSHPADPLGQRHSCLSGVRPRREGD